VLATALQDWALTTSEGEGIGGTSADIVEIEMEASAEEVGRGGRLGLWAGSESYASGGSTVERSRKRSSLLNNLATALRRVYTTVVVGIGHRALLMQRDPDSAEPIVGGHAVGEHEVRKLKQDRSKYSTLEKLRRKAITTRSRERTHGGKSDLEFLHRKRVKGRGRKRGKRYGECGIGRERGAEIACEVLATLGLSMSASRHLAKRSCWLG
jgi:hypothetical protein